MSKRTSGGSRFLYEPFDVATARIETNERINEERWSNLEKRLGVIETMLERLEKRLWLAVFGVVAAVLSRGVLGLLEIAGN
jgi:hypothetical protein